MSEPPIRSYVSMARWTLGIAWEKCSGLLTGLAITTVARGVIPAAAALMARGLIDATLPQLSAEAPSLVPVIPWLVAGMVIAVFEATLHLFRDYLFRRLTDDLNLEVTGRILTQASRLDAAYFESSSSQDLLHRAQNRAGERFAEFIGGVFEIGMTAVQIASLAAVLVAVEPWTLIALLVIAFPYLRFQSNLATTSFDVEQARTSKRRWTSYFVHQLTVQPAVSEVKVLGLGPLLIDKFRALMSEFRDEDRTLYRKSLAGSSVFSLTSTVVFYGLMARVVMRAIEGAASLGDVAIYAGATARLRGAVQEGVTGFRRLKAASLHIANLRLYLTERPALQPGRGLRPDALQGSLELDEVHFSYPGAVEPALRGVSLRVEAGETLALVGENGSGKTTIVKLLARLYDPTGGAIRLDGHELAEFDVDYLHEHIGFVFQNFTRYEATAAENIAYGNWQQLLANRERVEQVARMAGVDELIASMPNGYGTALGPRFGEHDLSGGQWQRIAIARAFARPAALLILDEPTASLDVRAEYELFERFRDLAHGRTTILVSHRFSTVAMADRIAVLDQGQIIELGTHEELMRNGGHYAELHGLHRRDAM